jgi:hypothetical protein
MNELRENLIDRMIRIYGFENSIVIDFCRLCERVPKSGAWDEVLRIVCESHEEHPADTIGELEDWPNGDDWGHLPTIGEVEGWSGEVW